MTGQSIEVAEGDCCDFDFLSEQFRRFAPDAVVHYAEQPSAPYSMMGYDEARTTLSNNLIGDAQRHLGGAAPRPRLPHHQARAPWANTARPTSISRKAGSTSSTRAAATEFLFPRQAGSLYHTTKVLDTDLLWFYVRIYGLQRHRSDAGPGLWTVDATKRELHPQLLPNFHYDDIFGTVVNRFLVQAVAGVPLTVYGKGGQMRGYLNLARHAAMHQRWRRSNPPRKGELRILNQFTETFSVNDLAERVKRVGAGMGLPVEIQHHRQPAQGAGGALLQPGASRAAASLGCSRI